MTGRRLPALEIIHLALTSRCNLSCRFCYQRRGGEELPLAQMVNLAQAAQLGCRRIMFSGGEPLLHGSIVEVVAIARAYGMETHLSSNGVLLDAALASALRQAGLDRFFLSAGPLSAEAAAKPDEHLRGMLRTASTLIQARIDTSLSLIVTRRNLDQLMGILKWFAARGIGRFYLIRPKPSFRGSWFDSCRLGGGDLNRLRSIKSELEALAGVDAIETDCSLHLLAHGLPRETILRRYGEGCSAGRSVLHIDAGGDVYPCAHLRRPGMKAGNAEADSLAGLWRTSEVLDRFRHLEPEGSCRICGTRDYCGGCRAIAFHDTGRETAEDGDCPFAQRYKNLHRVGDG